MDLEGAANAGTPSAHPDSWTKRRSPFWIIVPGLVLIGGIAACVCWNPGCGRVTHEMHDHGVISEVSQSIFDDELDRGMFPPGDGKRSGELVKCLQAPGPKKMPYMDIDPDRVDSQGNLRVPSGKDCIVYYRSPGLHHLKTFDLWCEDSKGRPDGINNWEK